MTTQILFFVLYWSGVVQSFLVPLPAQETLQHSSSIIQRHGTANKELDPEKDLDKILKPNKANKISIHKNNEYPDDRMSDLSTTPYLEEHDPDELGVGDVPIPTTGVSVADEMAKAAKDRFYTEVVRIRGLGKGVKAAQIISSTTGGSIEPVRYLVRLSRLEEEDDEDVDEDDITAASSPSSLDSDAVEDFVMVDVPPYSENLAKAMQKMMGPNGRLASILVTCRDCIHYDDAPGVFTIRRADLLKWEKAFPDTAIVAYRMDIPRDCRESVTQRLDGYGPWALQDASAKAANNETFFETGIPMTFNEWDRETAMDILEGRRPPPSEEQVAELNENSKGDVIDLNADGKSQADSLRANEEGKRILAVYTPGRTYGSMSYIFPELDLCASGFTLPLEDAREENWGVSDFAGPALDCRGYITTSKAGIAKQMESARKLANNYIDRFRIVLPSRSDPFYLQEDVGERRQTLLEVVDQYEKLGIIYEQLGITGSSD
jgi:glyoxylase-like metal-dependent hydrolase (beta-lactamase superfamily II)